MLHHLAGAALRHDRPAGRRAEHHRPGRLRHGARRLHDPPRARPTLLTVGTRDFFDIQGSWDTFREVKLIYGRLGYGERVDLFESDEEHGFTRPRRIATARWMRRWLLKQDEAVDEPDFPIATDAELQCTRTGQVLTDFQDRSVFDLNARACPRAPNGPRGRQRQAVGRRIPSRR